MNVLFAFMKMVVKLVLVPVAIILFFLNIAMAIIRGIGVFATIFYNAFLVLCMLSILIMKTPSMWAGLGILFAVEVVVVGIFVFGQGLVQIVSEKTMDFLVS